MIALNTKYEILTPKGWSDFSGIITHDASTIIVINDGKLNCTEEHRLETTNGFIRADDLQIGDVILGEDSCEVYKIDIIYEPCEVYDALNVTKDNKYYTNGLVSHNCLEFLGSGNTLLSGDSLLGLTTSNPVLIDNHGIKYYERPQAGHEYIGTVDVSKGRGRDYSTVTIIDVTEKPFRQVATFRNNIISPLIFPNVVAKMGMAYNEAMIVVENNDAGQVVVNALHYDIEYPNVYSESVVKRGGLGVTMTKKIKRIGCSNLKDLIENKKLLVCDFDTVAELTTFEEKGNSYEASNGNHDDMVMNLVMFSWFVNQTFFTDMTDVDLREMLYKEKMREIEASVPFFGAIDDGVNDYDDPYQW